MNSSLGKIGTFNLRYCVRLLQWSIILCIPALYSSHFWEHCFEKTCVLDFLCVWFDLTIIKLNCWEFSTRSKCFQEDSSLSENWHYCIEWILVSSGLISKSCSDLPHGPEKIIYPLYSVPTNCDKINIYIMELLVIVRIKLANILCKVLKASLAHSKCCKCMG